jgi:hypothetical protein
MPALSSGSWTVGQTLNGTSPDLRNIALQTILVISGGALCREGYSLWPAAPAWKKTSWKSAGHCSPDGAGQQVLHIQQVLKRTLQGQTLKIKWCNLTSKTTTTRWQHRFIIGNAVLRMILQPFLKDKMCSGLCLWPRSLQTKTSLPPVSVIQVLWEPSHICPLTDCQRLFPSSQTTDGCYKDCRVIKPNYFLQASPQESMC